MTDIKEFGWSPEYEEIFKEYKERGFKPARICEEHKNIYKMYASGGEILGEISGKLRFALTGSEGIPAVGDWVAADIRHEENRATIHAVLPRKSCFYRKIAGNTSDKQIVATNFDIAFIMMSLNNDFNLRKLERYIVLTWDSGAAPVVILSKADLCSEQDSLAAKIEDIAPGVPVHVISSNTGTGIEEIKNYFREGRTIAVLGSSGVGKSTMINTIAGVELMKTNAIREGDDRGKHTTTHRQLIKLPNGALVIDTPGMREIGMSDVSDGFDQTFSDIEELAASCRFSDCRHIKEPGCAVLKAMEEGRLERARFENYLKLQKEAAFMERKQNQRARLEQKKMFKQISAFQKEYDILK